MGWTGCYHATNWKYVGGRRVVDRQKECDAYLNWTSWVKGGNITATNTVLKSAMVGSVYYAAVKTEKPGQPDKVWAAVFLTRGKRSDGTVWGYKDMSESSGPYERKCPAGILALLTPTDSEYANEWRKGCREYLDRKAQERKEGKKPPVLPNGVSMIEEKGRWVFSSEAYQVKTNYRYRGVAFSKKTYHDFDNAIRSFLIHYGTDGQRGEYGRITGREIVMFSKTVGA